MTTLLSTRDIARLVAARGLPHVLDQLVQRLEADFRRWPEFDKTPRVASHSPEGETMPEPPLANHSGQLSSIALTRSSDGTCSRDSKPDAAST